MKHKIHLLILFYFLLLGASASTTLKVPLGEIPLKMVMLKKQWVLITDKNIYRKSSSNFVQMVKAENLKITCALVLDDSLWIGTSKGLLLLIGTSLQREKASKDSLTLKGVITGLACDSQQHLWVSVFDNGVFRRTEKKFEKLLDVGTVSSLAANTQGDVWVGSDIGLYRFGGIENRWTRYAEEGVSGDGKEIPDNIVEQIFCDEMNNAWVVMPDNFTLIPADKKQEHFSFGGREANQIDLIHSIQSFEKKWSLFFTNKGILAFNFNSKQTSPVSNEVHASENQKLVLLDSRKIVKNGALKKNIFFITKKNKHNYWVATDSSIFQVKKNKFLGLLNE